MTLVPLVLVLTLALLGGAAWGQDFTLLSGGISIRLTQLNWLNDDGTVLAGSSRVGVAELAFDDTAAASLVGPDGVFLNLYTSSDGVNFQQEVENLYLQFDSVEELLDAHPGVEFDFGESTDGTAVGSLTFQISLSHDPLAPQATQPPPPSPQPSPTPTPQPSPTAASADPTLGDFRTFSKRPFPFEPVYTAPVPLGDYLVGGFEGGGSGQLGQRPAPAPWRPGWQPGPGVGRPVLLGAARPIAGGFPAVNEDRMGCAPGGVARSIRYMLDRRGAGGPNVQNIYTGLYNSMGTGPGGTSGQNMVNGKANWAAANGLNINTQFPVNTLPPVINALNNRGDVEINIVWRGGGHVAMVTSVSQLPNGLLQITYIDDPRQGDGVAQNQTTTLIVNPLNGAILAGFPIPGAVVATFLVENMP